MHRYYVTKLNKDGIMEYPPRPIPDTVGHYGENGIAFEGICGRFYGFVEYEKELPAFDVTNFALVPGPSPSYYPIDEEAARRAHEMMSFRDYQKGSKTWQYRVRVDEASMIADRQKKRIDPMYHEKVDRLLASFSRRLAENLNAESRIGTMCPSVLISGGSNFPVRKKQRQNEASERNMKEYQEIMGLISRICSVGTGSITTSKEEINDEVVNPQESLEEMYRRIQRMSDPAYLHTVTLDEVMDNVFEVKSAVIENLLYTGAYILAGAPKIGKSFLVAQIAHHVSTGQDLWGYKVHQGTVLYLALEDDESRLQRRMFRMFGVEGTSTLHFATSAKMIGSGLDEQLEKFVREHSDTKLIIVDTLQKVREMVSDNYSYSSDYEVIGKLKQFADRHGVCILIVHHTRKQPAGDSFEKISGTTGLSGCADGALIMQKEKRTDGKATLEISGRDQPDQRLYLSKDQERLVWLLDHAENELWKQPPDPVLEAVAKIVSDENREWEGSPTELAEALRLDMAVNRLTKHLNVNASRLLEEHQVKYEYKIKHEGRRIRLTYVVIEAPMLK